jgi:RHS repeat-associated protein
MCWGDDNAVLSLNGVASALLPVDGAHNTWRLQNDVGWLVQREGTAPNDTWTVTTPDGTQYFFGWETLSWDEGGVRHEYPTGARWTVPVYADDSGEPCRFAGDAVGVCDQPWRMNLVLKREPTGVETRYFYEEEINHYKALNGCCGADTSTPYTRAGYLNRIDYGILGPYAPPTARVSFFTEYRCNDLSNTCPTELRWQNSFLFPDVPGDMLCADGEPCPKTAPSFFEGKRYSGIRTEVFTDGGWRPVEQTNLYHEFKQNDDGETKLYARSLQRHGFTSGEWLWLPAVEFQYTQLPNLVRADPNGHRMGHFRLNTVRDEYGHETRVTYGQQNPCPADYAGPWYSNTTDCFGTGSGTSLRVWNKYLVMAVEDVDTNGGSPGIGTTYTYEGAPAWHIEHTIWLGGGHRRAISGDSTLWHEWRGYGKVLVTQGASRTRLQVFRGMNKDRTTVLNQSRNVSVTSLIDGRQFADEPALAGRILDEQTFSSGGGILTTVEHEYETRVTLQPTTDPLDWASWSGEVATTRGSLKDANAGTYALTRTRATFNAHFQPVTLLEEGWVDQTGDERCTRTSYAENPGKAMYSYAASVQMVAGDCASTNELTYRETYYDNTATLGVAPTQGLATKTRVKVNDTTFAATTTTYDPFGRPRVVTDPLGHTTTTDYEAAPAGEYPNWSSVTNHLGHKVTTEWLPDRAVPLKVTDANNKVTTYSYDGFGRLRKQWSPTEQGGGPATIETSYVVAANREAPPYMQTRRLLSRTPDRFVDSWVVYDSLLRERQSQRRSPTSGSLIVTSTEYNGQGQISTRGLPQASSVTPGQISASALVNKVTVGYDELGRVTKETAWWTGNIKAVTTTAYAFDSTTVTPPVGGAIRTIFDGLGRTASVGEQNGSGWAGGIYLYDLADNLTTVLDANWVATDTYTYDKAGHQLTSDSIDAGAWSYSYDLAGNPTSVTDATGASVHTVYDAIDRPKERRQTSPTGPLLATWAYDAPGELGLLDTGTQVTPQGNWTSDITGYDARNRPNGSTLKVPTGIPGLSGNYTVSYGYDAGDHRTSVTYPAIGGLAQETVTTRFNDLGKPDQLTGSDPYVWSVTYDDRGRLDTMGYGPRPGGQTWMARSWTYDQDQRLKKVEAVAGSTTSSHQFTYDPSGVLTERSTVIGSDDWRECYGYDERHRLTGARTVDVGATCAASTPDGGDRPYKHTYGYSVDGNMVTRVENSATSTYTYPAANADRHHAPTKVVTGSTTDTYTWGDNGELRSRTVSGQTDTFTWDADHRLASISGPGGTVSNLYDTDGQRFLRTTPTGRTLYFAGQEISAKLDGTNVRAVRTYSLDGTVIATRSPSGVDYLGVDQEASTETAFTSGGGLETSRAYNPYGERRSGGEFDSDRGWIGQIEDDSTKLSYLNARYYDPNIGVFLSPDPVLQLDSPKSLNRYAYANNNPVTFTDGSGKCPGCPDGLSSERWRTDPYATAISVVHGGTSVAAAAHTLRPTDYHWNPKTYDPAKDRAIRDAITLTAMAMDNPNPEFWQALAAAGSADNLILAGMCAVNCDPAFWQAIAAAAAFNAAAAEQSPSPDDPWDQHNAPPWETAVQGAACINLIGEVKCGLIADTAIAALEDAHNIYGKDTAGANAYQHCLGSAMVVSIVGDEQTARSITNLHEVYTTGNDGRDAQADVFNNEYGFAVGLGVDTLEDARFECQLLTDAGILDIGD